MICAMVIRNHRSGFVVIGKNGDSVEEKCIEEKYIKEKYIEEEPFHRTEMRRQLIIDQLKEKGCRITRQRKLLLDIILEGECGCCKDIYFLAAKEDDKVSIATVYRMVNLLEEIGAISRKNMYRISCTPMVQRETGDVCIAELDDGTVCRLSASDFTRVLAVGLKEWGYLDGQKISKVSVLGIQQND